MKMSRQRLPRHLPGTVKGQMRMNRIDGASQTNPEDHEKSLNAARERVARSENGRAWLNRISKI